MPDPLKMLAAMGLAAVVAAALSLVGRWPWKGAAEKRAGILFVLGAASGFSLGVWWLEIVWHWPPREDMDRLLLIVLPAVVAVEIGTAALPRLVIGHWILRLILAAGLAPTLLFGSTYLSGGNAWSPGQSALILGGIAASFLGTWAATSVLADRTRSASIPIALSGVILGTSLTVMLSGYASGGQPGFPLAASLAGLVIAGLISRPANWQPAVALGVSGIFSLVVIGHFFGELTIVNACLLALAPLAGWLMELPWINRWPVWLRSTGRVGLTAVPVIVALVLAQQKFVEDSATPSSISGEGEPSIQDYLKYGK